MCVPELLTAAYQSLVAKGPLRRWISRKDFSRADSVPRAHETGTGIQRALTQRLCMVTMKYRRREQRRAGRSSEPRPPGRRGTRGKRYIADIGSTATAGRKVLHVRRAMYRFEEAKGVRESRRGRQEEKPAQARSSSRRSRQGCDDGRPVVKERPARRAAGGVFWAEANCNGP